MQPIDRDVTRLLFWVISLFVFRIESLVIVFELSLLCNMTETAVIKIGAGISGLTLAQHLHQQHNPFRIFERDEGISSRSGGWGLTLHWALPALRELLPEHILSRLPETFVDREAPAQGSPGKYQFF